ncbi:MAG: RidA family protein [Anaerolineae bacterium]|nr:RidA family protein [Anaerolineae bacterium]
MSDHYERIHLEENDPKWNMPYTPAIKIHSGKTVYISGVTAAPVYHSHPHISAEFDQIPDDAGQQTEMTMENLLRVLKAAGGQITDIVHVTRFMVDQEKNQDAINRVMGRYFGDHRPTSTSVEIVRLATDPRLVLEIEAVAVVPE